MQKFLEKILGSYNEKELKKLRKLVTKVVTKESNFTSMSDDELKAQFLEWKEILTKNPEKTDDLMFDVFAGVKEAAKRLVGHKYEVRGKEETWEMVHYDVQILGGIVIHQGKIAEMKTGEGKTLVSTLPIILNALTGRGVHVVTVNDYLAQRDREWMIPLFEFCGLTSGCIVHGVSNDDRRKAYQADITYGTNNEFGFDYLRDNMAQTPEALVQRELHFAIVDEIDSILIDEARTPLIISAPADESTDKYGHYASLIPQLVRDSHYTIDERTKNVVLTEEGITRMEKLLGVQNIYTDAGFEEVHHVEQSLKAHVIFEKDKDYVVRDGEVMIVDEFTGRLMPGRRYSNGLHQALEAKENVEIRRQSKTLATVTFQNYFRLYEKLSGMTGTAETEAEEFAKIYKLDTLVIPTNKPILRADLSDRIFKNPKGKYKALVTEVKRLHKKGQPVLVGTVSIDHSEVLAKLLTAAHIPHEVLNAKQHEREAEIVANAGQKGAVTIATNMAGRGTDIKITDEVRKLGGLAILGTERHESRRIDNQLRGRAGRQGDPGFSQFYVAMTDDLMRRFGGEKLAGMMDRLGIAEEEAIENNFISKSVESAQKKIEGFHFDARKHVVQYDDVMNIHREKIYTLRRDLLLHEEAEEKLIDILDQTSLSITDNHLPTPSLSPAWDMENLTEYLQTITGNLSVAETLKGIQTKEAAQEAIHEILNTTWTAKKETLPEADLIKILRYIMLKSIDDLWLNHINDMTDLRQRVALAGYAQKDPVMEYKKEAYDMFKRLMQKIRLTITQNIFRVHIKPRDIQPETYENAQTNEAQIQGNLEDTGEYDLKDGEKVGRNDPCPCGSGKKFKKCHGTPK